MYTVDTNILIYYAAGDERVAEFFIEGFKKEYRFFLPTIAVVEFFSFPALHPEEIELFTSLLVQFEITALTFDIALAAGDIRKKHQLSLGDSVVAATTLYTSSKLLTRNVRDFKNISGLEIVFL